MKDKQIRPGTVVQNKYTHNIFTVTKVCGDEICIKDSCGREFGPYLNDGFEVTSLPNMDDWRKRKKWDRHDPVYKPSHYTSGNMETINKIEAVIAGLPSPQAYLLGNVLKYFDRAGLKGNGLEDIAKAQNYAHRLITGEWKHRS